MTDNYRKIYLDGTEITGSHRIKINIKSVLMDNFIRLEYTSKVFTFTLAHAQNYLTVAYRCVLRES